MPDDAGYFSVDDCRTIADVVRRVLGQTAKPGGASPMASGIARLRVKSVADDYLVCRTWDGTTEGTTDINVAKPPVLRKTPYHGRTITFNGSALTFSYTGGAARTVTKSGGGSETQIIIPAYTGTGTGYGGEEIYAEYCPTGLKINAGQTNEEIVGLTDKNIDGRMWAKAT